MSYLLCGLMNITNTGWQNEYAAAMRELLEKHHGEFIVSGKPEQFEGSSEVADRLVVLKFKSEISAKNWYTDPENRKLIKLRNTGSTFELLGIEVSD